MTYERRPYRATELRSSAGSFVGSTYPEGDKKQSPSGSDISPVFVSVCIAAS